MRVTCREVTNEHFQLSLLGGFDEAKSLLRTLAEIQKSVFPKQIAAGSFEKGRRPKVLEIRFPLEAGDSTAALQDAEARVAFFEAMDLLIHDDALPWVKIGVVPHEIKLRGHWVDLAACAQYLVSKGDLPVLLPASSSVSEATRLHPVAYGVLCHRNRQGTWSGWPAAKTSDLGECVATLDDAHAAISKLAALFRAPGSSVVSWQALWATRLATKGAGVHLRQAIAVAENELKSRGKSQ